jgi:hypothetical protein
MIGRRADRPATPPYVLTPVRAHRSRATEETAA